MNNIIWMGETVRGRDGRNFRLETNDELSEFGILFLNYEGP